MIRVELGDGTNGVWPWVCTLYGVEGRSRQPLLDACREIKRMGGDTGALVGLFREEVRARLDMLGWLGC